MTPPTWGVVASVNEPPALIAAFVAHYLELGASRVHLYFDAPFDPVSAMLAHLPQVVMVRTGRAFYREFCKSVPRHINLRQRENAGHAYRNTDVDWLLHVDADEFLECPDLAARLTRIPPNLHAARIANLERAYLQEQPPMTVFDGVALHNHKHAKRWVRKSLDGDRAEFLQHGFLGHSSGKSIVRTGQGIRMGIHSPRNLTKAQKTWLSGAWLHHFDGMTPMHWMSKLLRYARTGVFMKAAEKATSLNRYNQIAWVADHNASAQSAQALHDQLRVLSPDHMALRGRFDLARSIGIDPISAVACWFPGQSFDLSVPGFDTALAGRSEDMAALLESAAAA